MKICLIGAGSFVFGPSVLYDAIVDHRLEGAHLALVDIRPEMAGWMAGLGRRLAADHGVGVRLTAHGGWKEALEGADFVICCAAVDLQRRFETDRQIIHRLAPGHLVTEFGGIQGISYSLRQIAMIRELARDMRALCPEAWLLCSANPLPRVCQAAHELGIRTAGFCCNSMGGYGLVGRVLHGWDERFPWPQAVARYEMVMAGLNHFTFTLDLRERGGGRALLPGFIERGRSQGAFEAQTLELIDQTGCWPANGDGHMRDFLPPHPAGRPDEVTSHGTAAEREARMETLRAAAEGRGPWEPLLAHRAWEKPVDFAVALSGGRPAVCHALNLVNEGQLPDLPAGVFVETPAVVDRAGARPLPLRLPEAVARISRPVAELTDCLVRAALTGRPELLDEAVERDPTILDKGAGRLALKACLAAHADLLEEG
jgi:alpha-galactosidase